MVELICVVWIEYRLLKVNTLINFDFETGKQRHEPNFLVCVLEVFTRDQLADGGVRTTKNITTTRYTLKSERNRNITNINPKWDQNEP